MQRILSPFALRISLQCASSKAGMVFYYTSVVKRNGMNIKEFKTIAQGLLKQDDYRKYQQTFPTIPISRREVFFSLLANHPIERALKISGGDLPPFRAQ